MRSFARCALGVVAVLTLGASYSFAQTPDRTTSPLRITEFRESGPGSTISVAGNCQQVANVPILSQEARCQTGPVDWFVEVTNLGNTAVTVDASESQGTGYGIFASRGPQSAFFQATFATPGNQQIDLVCVIPNGTVIQPGRSFLCGGSGYSLSTLGNAQGQPAGSVGPASVPGTAPGGTIYGANYPLMVGGQPSGLQTTTNTGQPNVQIGPNPTNGTTGSTGSIQPNPNSNTPFGDPYGFRNGDAGIALFGTTNVSINFVNPQAPTFFETAPNFQQIFPIDSIGFGDRAGQPQPPTSRIFCEGTCLEPVGFGEASVVSPQPFLTERIPQYSIIRRRSNNRAFSLPQDTDNNADDFILISNDPDNAVGFRTTNIPGVKSILGAPGPENLSDPVGFVFANAGRAGGPNIIGNASTTPSANFFVPDFFDTRTRSFNAGANIDRSWVVQDQQINNTTPLGTLTLRFRYTNNSNDQVVTRLRLRNFNLPTVCGDRRASPNGPSEMRQDQVGTASARNLNPAFVNPLNPPTPGNTPSTRICVGGAIAGAGNEDADLTAILNIQDAPGQDNIALPTGENGNFANFFVRPTPTPLAANGNPAGQPYGVTVYGTTREMVPDQTINGGGLNTGLTLNGLRWNKAGDVSQTGAPCTMPAAGTATGFPTGGAQGQNGFIFGPGGNNASGAPAFQACLAPGAGASANNPAGGPAAGTSTGDLNLGRTQPAGAPGQSGPPYGVNPPYIGPKPTAAATCGGIGVTTSPAGFGALPCTLAAQVRFGVYKSGNFRVAFMPEIETTGTSGTDLTPRVNPQQEGEWTPAISAKAPTSRKK